MAYRDAHDREMAKWAHDRLDAARRQVEEEQRQAVADVNQSACSATRFTE